MPRASSTAPSVPEKHRGSTITTCPGWNDVPCGTAIRRDEDICGFCRNERRREQPPAPPVVDLPPIDLAEELALDAVAMPPAEPVRPPPPPIRPERTPPVPAPPPAAIPMPPPEAKLHWRDAMPCGHLAKHVAPQYAETHDEVTCGRCRRILGLHRTAPPPEPPPAARGHQLSAGNIKALREADAEAERLREVGPRMGENRVRIDLTHYDTIRGLLRRVVGF